MISECAPSAVAVAQGVIILMKSPSEQTMTYIDEVCAALLRDTQEKYVNARDAMNALTPTSAEEARTAEFEAAKRDYLRASKEYLAVAFKTKFLGVELE